MKSSGSKIPWGIKDLGSQQLSLFLWSDAQGVPANERSTGSGPVKKRILPEPLRRKAG